MFQSYLNGVKRGFYWGLVNLYGESLQNEFQ